MDLYSISLTLVLVVTFVGAIAAVYFRDLLNAVVALAVMSGGLALAFFLMEAPDVAIAEAALGAGAITAIFILAIGETEREEKE
jgi:uncharacterized MnhB-related membrane protein